MNGEPQPGTIRKIERREHISSANVGIHGSGTVLAVVLAVVLEGYYMLVLDCFSSNSQHRERLQSSLYLGTLSSD